jgi:hypothetical protein
MEILGNSAVKTSASTGHGDPLDNSTSLTPGVKIEFLLLPGHPGRRDFYMITL